MQFRDIQVAKDNLKKDLRREDVAKIRNSSATVSVPVAC
jgi:hypothetical protein